MQPENSARCLTASDLIVREKQNHLIDGISLQLTEGQKVALVGLNGAGKSTLINLLTGVLQPTSGAISVDGMQPGDLDFKLKLGVQYANSSAIPNLTAFEYLSLCCQSKFNSQALVNDYISVVSKNWRLEKILHRSMSELSQGNVQKLIISQAFLGKPQYIFLDEPTQALDPVEQLRFIENLKSLIDFKLVVFSSHHINEAVAAADRVLMLHNGQLLADIDLQQVSVRWLMTKSNRSELIEQVSDEEGDKLTITTCYHGKQFNLFKVFAGEKLDLDSWFKKCQTRNIQFKINESPSGALLPIFSALANGEL